MLQKFVTIKMKEGCRISDVLWVKGEIDNGTIAVSRDSLDCMSFNFNCVHILRLFMKLSPTFQCAIRIDETSACETRDVAELVLFVHVESFVRSMDRVAAIQCEEQLHSLVNMFKANCIFHHTPYQFPQVVNGTGSVEMYIAVSWMHHVTMSQCVKYDHRVPISTSGWFYDHKTLTFTKVAAKSDVLRPSGYVVNTPSSAQKVDGINCYLQTLNEPYICPYICQESWLVNANVTMIICSNDTIEMWRQALVGRILALNTLQGLTTLSMHDIASTDVFLTTHEFLNSSSYKEWLALKVEFSHVPTQSAIRTFIRKAFFRRSSLSQTLPVVQAVKWKRVIIEDFNTFDCTFTKKMCFDCMFGLSDMVDAIPMRQINDIVMPGCATSTDVLSRCIYASWTESNVCERRLVPIRTQKFIISSNNHTYSWLHANVTLFSWFNYVPAWQRRKLLQALTINQTVEYCLEQIAKYGQKNEICPVCFSVCNCMTSCGHHFCDACLLNLAPTPTSNAVSTTQYSRKLRRQCPSCRSDISKVFTNENYIDTRIEKIIETCKHALREGQRVVVFSQWEEVFTPLLKGLKRRRLEVNSQNIRFAKLAENTVPNVREDLAIFSHVPLFTSKTLFHHILNRVRNTCKKVDIVFSRDTPEETILNELMGVGLADWTWQ